MNFVKLLSALIVAFLPLPVLGQWQPITNLNNTTQNYNGVDVAVTSVGNVMTGGGCNGLYWLPSTNDEYTYSFSQPVAAVKIEIDAINVGESVEFLINGAMFPIETCNLNSNPFVTNCSVGNCNIVNGQFVNNTAMWVCGGELTFYGPIGTFTVREPQGGSGASYNISFAPMGINVGGCIQLNSSNNAFATSINKSCAGPDLYTVTSSYNSNLTVQTHFGDGTIDTSVILQGTTSGGYAYVSHEYTFSGNYNLKQILYDGSTIVDSLVMNFDHLFCTHIPVQLYFDRNSNCVFDNLDKQPLQSTLVVVDSNSIPIDTFSATSGFYYKATGNPGDVYDIKVLPFYSTVPTCQTTGEINLTLQPLVYYTAPHYVGFSCTNTNDFDLNLNLAHLLTAANRSRINLLAGNLHCLPQNGILTLEFSPKYQFHSSNITPASQSGNTVTWNINDLSSFNAEEFVFVELLHNGQVLTPGDTVHTKLNITPTVGDVNMANNIIIREDTVTGPYDPNAVYVEPGNCVIPGTQLKYTITFENLGNAPANTISVMDTLSAGYDMSSFRLGAASHAMTFTEMNNGGLHILKFEFPDINLPGGNDPARHGFVTYTVDMQDNFPIGSSVTNKAGIYFDYMPAVLTNVASTTACWPTDVSTATSANSANLIYPNPATDELTIRPGVDFGSYSITNSLGQVMMKGMLERETRVGIKSLPAGIYYVLLKSDAGAENQKFIKL